MGVAIEGDFHGDSVMAVNMITRGDAIVGKLILIQELEFPDGTTQTTAAVSAPPVNFDSDQAVISAQVFG